MICVRAVVVAIVVIATVTIGTGTARLFSCENSTLLYSVKGQDDQQPFVVFQDRNTTRVFYQDPITGQWDQEADRDRHGKTCDFKVITQPTQQHCVTASDGTDDRNLRMCSDQTADPYADQTVAEHLVLVACSTDTSAFAKVANSEGSVHFLAAYTSMAELEHSLEWDAQNMSATVRNFIRKQTCDDGHHLATSSAILPETVARIATILVFLAISLL